MIIYGMKAKEIHSQSVNSVCENCSQSQHVVYMLQRYFHIFWIPVFPLRKQMVLECQNCKKTSLEKELPPQKVSALETARSAAKTPTHLFAGLALILLLVLWGAHSTTLENTQTQQYISNPTAGDLAVVEFKKDQFQVVKILSVDTEAIKCQVGNYLYKSLYSARKAIRSKTIGESDYFTAEAFEIPTSSYAELKISFVHREE